MEYETISGIIIIITIILFLIFAEIYCRSNIERDKMEVFIESLFFGGMIFMPICIIICMLTGFIFYS